MKMKTNKQKYRNSACRMAAEELKAALARLQRGAFPHTHRMVRGNSVRECAYIEGKRGVVRVDL